jgi:signal transduction histidine kinase
LARVKAANVAASGTTSTGIRLHVDAAEPVPILADPVQLRVVISSLLRNSLDALGAEGTITISARRIEKSGRPQAFFSITDTGPGLSPADREHLFDPFYSGRQAGRGLGFGLSKSWRIVTLHGGRIDVESPESGGAIFTITWPAASTSASGVEHQES